MIKSKWNLVKIEFSHIYANLLKEDGRFSNYCGICKMYIASFSTERLFDCEAPSVI